MSSTNKTDERIKCWLDANQLSRERLCQAILSIDKRFSNVKPRHPRGGPDGGRDLEAIYDNKYETFGAVGFMNSPSDSDADRNQLIRKFKSDFLRAIKEAPDLKAFVFFTNVNLTISEKETLINQSIKEGLIFCDILDRERLRIVLDSPDGLSIRYQYLNISLSDAEQASFFAKWGDDIQGLIISSFQAIDSRLNRIQFIQESVRPLRNIRLLIELEKELDIKELPHYRAVISISPRSIKSPYKKLHIATYNNSIKEIHSGGWDVLGAIWEDDVSEQLSNSASKRPNMIKFINANGGYSKWDFTEHTPCLADLDENFFGFFINEKLTKHIKNIKIFANEYLLWSASISDLSIDEHDHVPICPWEFSEEELTDKWLRLMPSSGVGVFNFSDITPVRFVNAKMLENKKCA